MCSQRPWDRELACRRLQNDLTGVSTTQALQPGDLLRTVASALARRPDLSLLKDDEQRLARLASDRAADVPLAGRVLGQQDVAAAQNALGSITHLDLDLALQVHHVLPARRGVKFVVVIPLSLAKHDAF